LKIRVLPEEVVMNSVQDKLFGPKRFIIIVSIILIGCGILLFKNIGERGWVALVVYTFAAKNRGL